MRLSAACNQEIHKLLVVYTIAHWICVDMKIVLVGLFFFPLCRNRNRFGARLEIFAKNTHATCGINACPPCSDLDSWHTRMQSRRLVAWSFAMLFQVGPFRDELAITLTDLTACW